MQIIQLRIDYEPAFSIVLFACLLLVIFNNKRVRYWPFVKCKDLFATLYALVVSFDIQKLFSLLNLMPVLPLSCSETRLSRSSNLFPTFSSIKISTLSIHETNNEPWRMNLSFFIIDIFFFLLLFLPLYLFV